MKTFELSDDLVNRLTKLQYLLDLNSIERVIIRATALLSLLEKEKDKDGYIRYFDVDGYRNKVKITGIQK